MARITPPFPVLLEDHRSELLAPTGEMVPPRLFIRDHSVVNIVADQRLVLNFFRAKRTEQVANLTLATGGTAAGATPTLIRLGVYEVGVNGTDLTLIASTPSDTTLFTGTHTFYTKALSASFTKHRGREYALGLLIVGAVTMPSFAGVQLASSGVGASLLAELSPAIQKWKASQADLPASITTFTGAGGGACLYWRMS